MNKLILSRQLFILAVFLFDACSAKTCIYHQRKYQLKYTNPTNIKLKGIDFECRLLPYLTYFGLLNNGKYLDFFKDSLREPTYVVGITMSWEQQAVLLLESIRTHFKSHRIVIYNLGISPQYLAKFKRICNVVIKSFDFKWYPPHVSNLSNSAWKSLIIADALREYEVIWQVDPTVRFQKNVLTQISSQVLPCTTKAKLSNNITSCGKSSFMFNQRTSHVLPASIHKNTLKYLPTEIPKIGKISSYTSSSLYVIRTDYTMNNIVKWHVLCALTQDCIAPLSINTQTNCRIINGIQQACHRFDESIINLLLVNAYGYTNDRYFSNIKRLHSIKRDKKQQLDLQLLQCK